VNSIWNIVLEHNDKKKVMEKYKTYKSAKEALDYRYMLWYHLGSNPDFKYSVEKVKENE
tara:strand:+ start:1246 stop:1422 length:177 start_codon:yes stop_codon:yes gene_type:complete